MNKKITLIVGTAILVLFGVWLFKAQKTAEPKLTHVVYGVSAFQDTILPIVAQKKGWYKQEGLNVEVKILNWDDVMGALAAHKADVVVGDMGTFQQSAESINEKGGDVIFYYASYLFKGNAIMVRNDGKFKTFQQMRALYPNDREKAIKETVKQLKGKTVLVTKGTSMEQIVLSAMEHASLNPETDVTLVHAQPSDNLTAFLHGEGDGFSGGLPERTSASRVGAAVLIEASDINPPFEEGLLTTKQFAREHPEVLKKLVKLWFQTIQYMSEDLDNRSLLVIDYLASVGSTRYTKDEFKYAWNDLQVFYRSPQEVQETILNAKSSYYWKKAWDFKNNFLLQEKKIKKPIPYSLFWGEEVDKKLRDY